MPGDLFTTDLDVDVDREGILAHACLSGSSRLRQDNLEKDSNDERNKRGKACISRKDAENAKKSRRQGKLTENEISLSRTLPRV